MLLLIALMSGPLSFERKMVSLLVSCSLVPGPSRVPHRSANFQAEHTSQSHQRHGLIQSNDHVMDFWLGPYLVGRCPLHLGPRWEPAPRARQASWHLQIIRSGELKWLLQAFRISTTCGQQKNTK